jgi:hypothetical protein
MTKDEALKLALEALETELCIDWTNVNESEAAAEKMHEAIAAIKEALAEPVQRTWVGLTAEQIASIPLNEHTLQTAERLLKDNNA